MQRKVRDMFVETDDSELNNKIVSHYVAINIEDDLDKLFLVSIGEEHCRLPYYFERPQGWFSEHLIYTFEGRGIARINGQTFECPEGSILNTPKDSSYSYEVDPGVGGGTWKYKWIEYDGPWARQIWDMMSLAGVFFIPDCHLLENLIDRMAQQLSTSVNQGRHKACALLLMLFAEIESITLNRKHESGYISDKMEIARQFMSDNIADPITIETLSRRVSLSPFHFARLFKQHTGTSPARYLRKLRIAKAKMLLRKRTLLISEVGVQVGYPVIQHFTAVFKKETGVAPSRYYS